MRREDLIRGAFDKSMDLIEIGASYNPIIAKSDGWRTTVVDYTDSDGLREKYRALGMEPERIARIEDVDLVWQGGSLAAVVPADRHGTFDGLIASHVCEHIPDLIGFLNDVATLLKPDGQIALALPDKRLCFDFFRPRSTTVDFIEAHELGRTRHARKAFFHQDAYTAFRNDKLTWVRGTETAPFHLICTLTKARDAYEQASEDPSRPYVDTHGWIFTPKSFELILLELNLLGYTDWAIKTIEPSDHAEFYIWLERRKVALNDIEANAVRLGLMTEIVYESRDAIAGLDAAEAAPAETAATAATWPRPRPSIVAIVPLYNGARYIEEAVTSIFRQTLPPNEVIVVNDGSTDDGAGVAIVERLAREYPLTLLHKQNGGQSSARNLGVRESKSDLIAFLDQDDAWYDNHLEELVKPFQRRTAPPLGWAYSNLDEFDENGSLMARSYLGALSAKHPKRHIFECIREDMFILPSASLINRRAFEAVDGFDERLCGYEDDDLFMRMFRAGFDNVYLDMPLSKWRIYPSSTSYTPRMARSRAIYTRKLLELYPDDPKRARYYARDLILPRFSRHAIREHEDALRSGDRAAINEAHSEIEFLAQFDPSMIPLVYDQALRRYREALLDGDDAEISAAWQNVADALARLPGRHLRRKAVIGLLKNPKVSRAAFGVRQMLRPAMRWAFAG